MARATGWRGHLRIAIIGKPTSGIALVNALVGKKRHVVTELPGTTRDPVDSVVNYHGESFVLVDTAAFERTAIAGALEFYSALRTLKEH